MLNKLYFVLTINASIERSVPFGVIDIKSSFLLVFCFYVLKPADAYTFNFIAGTVEYFIKVIRSMVAWMLGNTNSGSLLLRCW